MRERDQVSPAGSRDADAGANRGSPSSRASREAVRPIRASTLHRPGPSSASTTMTSRMMKFSSHPPFGVSVKKPLDAL